jgi:hypothetical protein
MYSPHDRSDESNSEIPNAKVSVAQGPLVLGRKCSRRFRWLSARSTPTAKVMPEEPPPAAESPEVA